MNSSARAVQRLSLGICLLFAQAAAEAQPPAAAPPDPMKGLMKSEETRQFVAAVESALRFGDSAGFASLNYKKDIPAPLQAMLDRSYQGLAKHLQTKTDWNVQVIPADAIPSHTTAQLNAPVVYGIEIVNFEHGYRCVFPVCLIGGHYMLAESKYQPSTK